MKPRLLGAALAAVVLAASPAAASTGWARYDDDTWVRYTVQAARPIAGENLTPTYKAALAAYMSARHAAIAAARSAHREWAAALARARAAAAERLRLARLRAASASGPAERPSSPAPDPPQHRGGSLRSMVCSFAWSCAVASCIVGRESGWNPRAYNPRSGSAGLFQIMPLWYRGRFDPFNPYANAAFAYHLYRMSGWSPWNGGQYSCF